MMSYVPICFTTSTYWLFYKDVSPPEICRPSFLFLTRLSLYLSRQPRSICLITSRPVPKSRRMARTARILTPPHLLPTSHHPLEVQRITWLLYIPPSYPARRTPTLIGRAHPHECVRPDMQCDITPADGSTPTRSTLTTRRGQPTADTMNIHSPTLLWKSVYPLSSARPSRIPSRRLMSNRTRK